MLPHKHYSGPAIEKVLSAFEEGATVNSVSESGGDGSLRVQSEVLRGKKAQLAAENCKVSL